MLSGSVAWNAGRPTAACKALMMFTAVGPPWISAMISWASVVVASGIGDAIVAYLSWTYCPWRLSNIVVAALNWTPLGGRGRRSPWRGVRGSRNPNRNFSTGTGTGLKGTG